jgi:hypothetical protein
MKPRLREKSTAGPTSRGMILKNKVMPWGSPGQEQR